MSIDQGTAYEDERCEDIADSCYETAEVIKLPIQRSLYGGIYLNALEDLPLFGRISDDLYATDGMSLEDGRATTYIIGRVSGFAVLIFRAYALDRHRLAREG